MLADRWLMGVVPLERIRLSLDPLHVVGALGVAVARAELSAGLVVATQVAVFGHLDEVERPVQAAGERADVDVEGELSVLQVEHLVLVAALHHVDARAVVLAVLVVRNEAKIKTTLPVGSDGVGGIVLGVFHDAIGSTRSRVGGAGGVPILILVAVLHVCVVHPAPVGIEYDLLLDHRRARRRIALLEVDSGSAGVERSGLLGCNRAEHGGQSRCARERGSHSDCFLLLLLLLFLGGLFVFVCLFCFWGGLLFALSQKRRRG
mmetsp:Transcript_99129/g.206639  ORF Transcript_99129/g.206639 Transcript_99129/m.206639 type:complete len:262 (+) Transcript_99129:925-1710(+)